MHALKHPIEEVVNKLFIDSATGRPELLNDRGGNLHGVGLHADLRLQQGRHVLLQHLQISLISDELLGVLVNHSDCELSECRDQVAHPLVPISLVLNDGIRECLVYGVHNSRVSDEYGVQLKSIADHVGDILHYYVVEGTLHYVFNVVKHLGGAFQVPEGQRGRFKQDVYVVGARLRFISGC